MTNSERHPDLYDVALGCVALRALAADTGQDPAYAQLTPRYRAWGEPNLSLSSLCELGDHTVCYGLRMDWRTAESVSCLCLCHQATRSDYYAARTAERTAGLTGYVNPDGSGRGIGAAEWPAGLDENELRALAGDR